VGSDQAEWCKHQQKGIDNLERQTIEPHFSEIAAPPIPLATAHRDPTEKWRKSEVGWLMLKRKRSCISFHLARARLLFTGRLVSWADCRASPWSTLYRMARKIRLPSERRGTTSPPADRWSRTVARCRRWWTGCLGWCASDAPRRFYKRPRRILPQTRSPNKYVTRASSTVAPTRSCGPFFLFFCWSCCRGECYRRDICRRRWKDMTLLQSFSPTFITENDLYLKKIILNKWSSRN